MSDSKSCELPHLTFIVGPTACSKSDFAVSATSRCPIAKGTEIINCDSVQFFAGVEIGAAKPSRDLLNQVPHHLLGHVALGQSYTAGDFRRDALRVIEDQASLGCRQFFAVGGSGFHIQALEKGMFDVPEVSDELKNQLKIEADRDLNSLYLELKRRDAETALKIQSVDRYRILRALEILRSIPERQTLSEIREKFAESRPPPPFTLQKIGLFRPRDILRTRVTERTRVMLAAGLIEEVESLRAQGLGAWAPLLSVGYREVQEMLDGKLERANLEQAIVTSTMQLAKRQMTWFKRDPEIRWFNVETDLNDAFRYLEATLS